MTYNNDQFYRISSRGETPIGGRAQNPKFIYPDSTIRTQDSESATGIRPIGKGVVAFLPKEEQLQRGYIRSLDVANTISPRKCQFQFNPQTLKHGVSMNESMLNHFSQDPGQFAQPMAGDVAFTFNIFFDRSMELNNPLQPNYNFNAAANPWEAQPAEQVGVLKDIAALYGVIGQGMSKAQKDYITQQLTETIQLETIDKGKGLEDNTDILADETKALGNIPEFLDQNIGNTAFLLPLPVRMVFSSLYMVEGYCTDTDVTFTKFTTQMVPMQCVVRVNLRAQYVGFAKKDTFLTYALEQRLKAIEDNALEAQAAQNDLYANLLAEMTQVELAVTLQHPTGTTPPGTLQNILTTDGGLYSGELPYRLGIKFPNAQKQGAVFDLYQQNMSIQWSARMKAYTGMGPEVPTNGWGLPLDSPWKPEPVLSKTATQNPLSTKADWAGIFNLPGESGEHTLGIWSPPRTPTPAEDHIDAKGAVEYTVQITVVHDGTTITGKGTASPSDNDMTGGSQLWVGSLNTSVNIEWDITSDPTDVSAPVSNATNTSNVVQPGTPSNVGSLPYLGNVT